MPFDYSKFKSVLCIKIIAYSQKYGMLIRACRIFLFVEVQVTKTGVFGLFFAFVVLFILTFLRYIV